jgi:hypothetical protein
MSITATSRNDFALGTKLMFCRAGDTVDGIVVGPETVSTTGGKPDTNPTTNWPELGTVTDFEPQNKQTSVTKYKPVPGGMVPRDKILLMNEMTYMVSLQEMSLVVLEILFGASRPDLTTGAFVPGGMTGLVKGWFKVQQYNQLSALVNSMDIWGSLEIKPYKFQSGKLDDYALEITQLYSTLNTGAISGV